MTPTPWSNFLHFHAVFRKFWSNNKLSLCGCHLSWEILDPPLFVDRCEVQQTTTCCLCCWLKSSRHVEACSHISLTAMTIYLSATTWNSWTKNWANNKELEVEHVGGSDENYNIAHFLTLRAVSFSAM